MKRGSKGNVRVDGGRVVVDGIRSGWIGAVGLFIGLMGLGCNGADTMDRARENMILRDLRGRGITNEAVLAAMKEVPRHHFVPEEGRVHAYGDHPLPIGHGQTISQPYMVAAMTELVRPEPDHVVLEVGTGSGYQAAILSRLVRHVYTIEIVPELGEQARRVLLAEGYSNVTVRVGDGYAGWPEKAPFDAIVVTCGAEEIPPPLLEQLRPGGIMVIPVGSLHLGQDLLVAIKGDDGGIRSQRVMPVRFVPMTGKAQDKGKTMP